MKGIIFLATAVFLPSVILGQERAPKAADPAALEMNFTRTLWFNSSNAAGMALAPLSDYNIVSAAYGHTSGGFRTLQRGDSESSATFNTNGALMAGKIALWGDFTFSRDVWKGAQYNTNRYSPDPDMPYYVADPNKGDWNKQLYDMSVKAAFPLLWNRVAFGAGLNYVNYKGAKQIDPRGVPVGYGILVSPSVAVKISDAHSVGLTFEYENSFERSNFSNVQGGSSIVYLMKGLGNFSSGSVDGTGGVGAYYYPGNRFGGTFQYGFSSSVDILLDVTYAKTKLECFQNPQTEYRMGTSDKELIGADVQFLWGESAAHKITAGYSQTKTAGTEYLQERDNSDDTKPYVILAELDMSSYDSRRASLGYDGYIVDGQGYSWNFGAEVSYMERNERYFVPESTFGYRNAYGELHLKKRFKAGKVHKILLGLSGGYNHNLSGEYDYNGADPDHGVVTDLYATELRYYTSDWASLGWSFDYTLGLGRKNALNFGLNGRNIWPSGWDSARLFVQGAVSFIF